MNTVSPNVPSIGENVKILRRQPWFVATLSWLFPGVGQLFAGAYLRALAFVLLTVSFRAVFVLSCTRSDMSRAACIGLRLCGMLLPAAWAARDAFKLVSLPKDRTALETRPSDAASYFPAFLSAILPGLGQAYLHKWLWAAVYFLLYVTFRRLSLHSEFGTFAVTIAMHTISAVHAYVMHSQESKRHRRSLLPIIASLIAVCLVLQCLVALCQDAFFVSFVRPIGPSMMPTIMPKDHMVLDRLAYASGDPVAGDIVLFHAPECARGSSTAAVCKRIVAVGGQTIELRDGRVYVDGQSKHFESGGYRYLRPGTSLGTHLDTTGSSLTRYAVGVPYHVPDDCYFVLGDNRNNSIDSRRYGAIPRKSIIGRVVKCWRRDGGVTVFQRAGVRLKAGGLGGGARDVTEDKDR